MLRSLVRCPAHAPALTEPYALLRAKWSRMTKMQFMQLVDIVHEMPIVDLSDSTYRELLRRSVSFDDTAERVIKRLLEITCDGGSDPRASEHRPPGPRRANPGSILPERAYWLPILGVIADAGGSAASTDVIDALSERLGGSFTDRDRDVLAMGEVRWRNRARFARLRMKERGFLNDQSPRGVWEITDVGRQFLEAA